MTQKERDKLESMADALNNVRALTKEVEQHLKETDRLRKELEAERDAALRMQRLLNRPVKCECPGCGNVFTVKP